LSIVTDVTALAAKDWYGYGTWNAPYWFIGPEPGMAKNEGDNLEARCDAWEKLGSPELLDCALHHRTFGLTKWHDRTVSMNLPINGATMRPPTQSTWRRLIALLLAYKGERTDNDAIGDYQASSWGSTSGETCVVELSALAANSLATVRDRGTFLDERCAHLRKRMLENKPVFAVMYGLRAKMSYEGIACAQFDANGYAWVGQTLCVIVKHPTARRGHPPMWWAAKGQQMRMAIANHCEALAQR
jgi:hypothetical protein